MIRLLAIQIGLFLLPFLVWGLVHALRAREGRVFADAPLFKLTLAGLALTIVAFFALVAFEGGEADGTYVPDRFENGHLVPGGIRRGTP